MKKATKIWLWIALAVSVCTTIMNAMNARWVSVAIALVSILCLGVLLFMQKRIAFVGMCLCAVLTGLYSIINTVRLGGTGVVVGILMSVVGAALIPAITAVFLAKDHG